MAKQDTPKISSKAVKPQSGVGGKVAAPVSEDVEKRLKHWRKEASDAEKLHESWEKAFDCRMLHSMWAGPGQWPVEENEDNDRYYVNLFFSGVETRRPSLVFHVPNVRVNPKPSRTDDPANTTTYSAKLGEDTVNTIFTDKRVGVLFNCGLALHESFFRMGVVEVGIAGDTTTNPRANKPAIDPESGSNYGDDDKPLIEPEYLVTEERPFVRRIPAEQFLISSSNKNDLYANDWVGYYDYVRKEDVEANPFYKKVKGVKVSAQLRADGTSSGYVPEQKIDGQYAGGRIKLLKIWDFRAKKRYVFSETGDDFYEDGHPWKTLPLRILKFHEILDSFYPKPPTYDWVPPQREANAERDSQKTHRKRFNRKYKYKKGKFEPDDLDKLEIGADGTMIPVTNMDDIDLIADGPQDPQTNTNFGLARRDFTEVSAIGAEQRQIAESETATQASIIDKNAQVRESFDRQVVASWIADIAQTLLAILYEEASLPFWIHTNVDVYSPNAEAEAMEIAKSFQIMRPEYLEDYGEWELTVDMASMVPAVEEAEKRDWMTMLQVLTNPPMALLMLASDVILRETLAKFNIRDEKKIQEIKKALFAVENYKAQAQLMAAMGQPATPPFDPSSSGKPSPPGLPGMTTPGPGVMPELPQIQEQLTKQLGGGVPGIAR